MKNLKFLWLFSVVFTIGIASCSLFDFENDTDTNTENNDCNCINYQVCINNVCECPEGYSGTQCQQIDDCANVACVNGGGCVNGSCVCPQGYTGTNCQYPVDPCADDICVNGTLYSGCECICDDGWEGEFCSTPAPGIDVFTPDDIENICPYHIGGDREFSGNGPEVTIRCEAVPEWDKIYVDIYFHAKETTPDWTEAEIETRRKIYDAPPGKKIHRIVSPTVSNADYLDTNLYDDFPDVYGGLVRKFRSIGDTGGNDLGPCIDDSDAELNIEFNPMTIELVDK